MIPIESKITGKEFALIELENKLKPLGYDFGDNWEYDHGTFDYKIADDGSYVFLRLPFEAIEGALDRDGCMVKLGEPFMLHHKYQSEDEKPEHHVGDFGAVMNQFQTPTQMDADVPEEFWDRGRELVDQLERVLT